jgi:hypothetical protein
MRKITGLIAALLMGFTMTGCTMEEVSATLDEQTAGFTEQVSEQFDEISQDIDVKISETMDETIDQASEAAEKAIEDAKDKAIEKAQDKTEEEISEFADDLVENIGIQIDKLVEFRPGSYFEEPSEVTYDKDGIRMNAYWEYAENKADFATYESGAISLSEESVQVSIPDGSIVTVSFFDTLPDEVTVFAMLDGVGEEVIVSEMKNPLTGKNTYSFEVLFEESSDRTYVIYAKFENMDECEITLRINKQ